MDINETRRTFIDINEKLRCGDRAPVVLAIIVVGLPLFANFKSQLTFNTLVHAVVAGDSFTWLHMALDG